jgi:hypothetical protein
MRTVVLPLTVITLGAVGWRELQRWRREHP